MAIYKKDGKGFFAAVDSRVIRNQLLSVPAIGLLAVLLDRSRTWQVRVCELRKSLPADPDTIERLFSELIEKGFAVERRDRFGVYYDIYAFPEHPPQTVPKTGGPAPQAKRAPEDAADPVPPRAMQREAASGRPLQREAPRSGGEGDPPASQGGADRPTAPEGLSWKPGPMPDGDRALWMDFIQNRFPQTVKSCDLNRAVGKP